MKLRIHFYPFCMVQVIITTQLKFHGSLNLVSVLLDLLPSNSFSQIKMILEKLKLIISFHAWNALMIFFCLRIKSQLSVALKALFDLASVYLTLYHLFPSYSEGLSLLWKSLPSLVSRPLNACFLYWEQSSLSFFS